MFLGNKCFGDKQELTYPVFSDKCYSGFPRRYYTCQICGKQCRHLTRHNNKCHKEVHRY